MGIFRFLDGILFLRAAVYAFAALGWMHGIALGEGAPALRGTGPASFCVQRFANFVPRPGQRALADIKELKVETINARELVGTEPEYKSVPRFAVAPKPERQLLALGRTLRESAPDVVVVQEAGGETVLKKLVQAEGGHYRVMMVYGNSPSSAHIGFLVRRDLPLDLTLESHRDKTWLNPVTRKIERVFDRDLPVLVARPTGADPNSRPLFVVLGTHNKANRTSARPETRPTVTPTQKREAQANATAQIIREYQTRFGEGVPLMIAGDFNGVAAQAPEYAPLRQRDIMMADAFDLSKRPVPQDQRATTTSFVSHGVSQGWQPDAVLIAPSLHGSVLDARVIDYVDEFGKPIPKPMSRRDVEELHPSDHRPVLIRLDFVEMMKRWMPEVLQRQR